MRKKSKVILCVLGIVTLGGLFGCYKIADMISIDVVNDKVYVEDKIYSRYSYVLFTDHVELLEYLGGEKHVKIPDKLFGKPVTVIAEECFLEKEMESVFLGANIQEIASYAFAYCDDLESVSSNIELNIINNHTFVGCDALKTVDVGNSIKRIEMYAFCGCQNLQSIGLQDDLQYIGEKAFARTGSLGELSIESDVELGDAVLAGSEWILNQKEEYVIVGDGCLVHYNGTDEKIAVPNGVKKIDYDIFASNRQKDKEKIIYLSETVEELVSGCFFSCGKVKVYIPESVTVIDEMYSNLKTTEDENGLTLNNDTITIVTTSGSYAEKYAKKYGIKCEIVESW